MGVYDCPTLCRHTQGFLCHRICRFLLLTGLSCRIQSNGHTRLDTRGVKNSLFKTAIERLLGNSSSRRSGKVTSKLRNPCPPMSSYAESQVILAMQRSAAVVAPSIHCKCNQAVRHMTQPTKPSHIKDATNKAITHDDTIHKPSHTMTQHTSHRSQNDATTHTLATNMVSFIPLLSESLAGE
ncbi:hypothetical protein TNCV_3604661 [Trichonephila clavipes]|nr:hypothetical protein TNCV_3604661 [Trichonephila clavipes]